MVKTEMFFLQKDERGALPVLILLTVVGLISFFVVSSVAPFRDKVLSTLFPKQFSQAAEDITFTPSVIPFTDPEITNPYRGSYYWNRVTTQPSDWPSFDGYIRYNWSALESSEGVYNFHVIDNDLAKVKAQGGKMGISIMPANSYSGGAVVPQYLVERMSSSNAEGWFWHSHNQKNTYTPDWNHPDYIKRFNALITAIAERYKNEPALDWYHMMGYGDFSEWHIWQFPSWNTPMTSENMRAILDHQYNAFAGKRMIALKDNPEMFAYAMQKSDKVGWGNMCFSDPWFSNGMNDLFAKYPWAKDRWKTAPVVVEYCGPHMGVQQMSLAYQQVQDFHVALIGNGNFGTLSSFSSQDQETYKNIYKKSGYRFELKDITLPGTIAAGSPFTVKTNWINTGVTPAYTPWNTMIQLRQTNTNNVVWEGKSTVDFEKILPTGATPHTVTDTFTIPASTAQGSYDVIMIIKDPGNYYPALKLAIRGRAADGSYKLGTISVGESGPITPISVPLRVDSAGSTMGTWNSDTGFVDGSTVDRGTIEISNTTEPFIYQTERWGLTGYRFPIANGNYIVKLHFAETSPVITATGQRVFSVDVEGNLIANLDVFAETGGRNRAFIKEIPVSVSDGMLNITFTKQVQEPMINGIEILSDSGATVVPTPTAISVPTTIPTPVATPIPTPTPISTPIPTPVPTPTPMAHQMPSAPVITKNVSCISSNYMGNGVTVSWTNSGSKPVTWVDISTSSSFTTNYHKSISSGGMSTQLPVGFTLENGSQALILTPNVTYYVRLYNGAQVPVGDTYHSAVTSFSLTECLSAGSTIKIDASGTQGKNGLYATMELRIDNKIVKTFKVNGTMQAYTYTTPAKVKASQIKVGFWEDDGPRDLRVPGITVDGVYYPTASSNVYYYSPICKMNGFNVWKVDTLWCNGDLSYR